MHGAEVWTHVRAADGTRWAAGRTVFRNAQGGRVAVIAATDTAALPGSDAARRLLHRTIRYLEGENPELPLVSGGPHLIPQLSRGEGFIRLAVANGSADPVHPVVDLPGDLLGDLPGALVGAKADAKATVLAPLAEPCDVTLADARLEHRSWLILEWPSAAALRPPSC